MDRFLNCFLNNYLLLELKFSVHSFYGFFLSFLVLFCFVFFYQALDFSDDEKEREAKQKKKKLQSQGRKKLRSETNASSE